MLAVPFAVLIVGKIMSPLTMNTVGEGEGEFFANIFGADYMPQFYFTYTVGGLYRYLVLNRP